MAVLSGSVVALGNGGFVVAVIGFTFELFVEDEDFCNLLNFSALSFINCCLSMIELFVLVNIFFFLNILNPI